MQNFQRRNRSMGPARATSIAAAQSCDYWLSACLATLTCVLALFILSGAAPAPDVSAGRNAEALSDNQSGQILPHHHATLVGKTSVRIAHFEPSEFSAKDFADWEAAPAEAGAAARR